MTVYVYDSKKHVVKYHDEKVYFYCGLELTDEAIHILDIYFKRKTPQDALIDNILKRHCCKKGEK